jgi:hypothetical protein
MQQIEERVRVAITIVDLSTLPPPHILPRFCG